MAHSGSFHFHNRHPTALRLSSSKNISNTCCICHTHIYMCSIWQHTVRTYMLNLRCSFVVSCHKVFLRLVCQRTLQLPYFLSILSICKPENVCLHQQKHDIHQKSSNSKPLILHVIESSSGKDCRILERFELEGILTLISFQLSAMDRDTFQYIKFLNAPPNLALSEQGSKC